MFGPLWRFAMRASQRQIGWLRRPFVLGGDDMVDLKRQRQSEFREPAILASFARSRPDLPEPVRDSLPMRAWF